MTRKQFVITLAVVVVAGLLGGALSERTYRQRPAFAQEDEPQVVRAQQFVVVDDGGKDQAVLGAAPWGGPRLEFYDQEGNERLAVALGTDGNPYLGLYARDLFLREDGSSALSLGLIGEQSIPRLSMLDPVGNTRVTLALTPEGDPQLVLSDGNDVGRLVCEVLEDGSPEITLRDEKNEPFWFAP